MHNKTDVCLQKFMKKGRKNFFLIVRYVRESAGSTGLKEDKGTAVLVPE